jgi:malate synthase
LHEEVDRLEKLKKALEEAVYNSENEVMQTRIALETIIEELKKDLHVSHEERQMIASQYEEVVLERDTMKNEFRVQLQNIVSESADKETVLAEGFQLEV